jgi:hypothetical protein
MYCADDHERVPLGDLERGQVADLVQVLAERLG